MKAAEDGDTIAVIGGGVAGITAAHLLQRRLRVTLYESNGYIGGHTNTVVIEGGPDAGTPVDTGFIVLNDRTYPTFHRLLADLRVPYRDSDMSFGYHCRETGLQYAGTDLSGLLADRGNVLKPAFLAMVRDIGRFALKAERDMRENRVNGGTLRDYLAAGRYSESFIRHYLVPLGGAIWSASDGELLDFPASTFLNFFDNHGLISLYDRPQWQTVVGGSHSYVKAFLKGFRGVVRKGAQVLSVRREAGGAVVETAAGAERFDFVVIAAHADEALSLLCDPSAEEKRLLGVWTYSNNRTVLHTDASVLPPNRRAWASWNYSREAGGEGPVAVTYHMNRLQGLRAGREYCVTLNPRRALRPESIIREFNYRHPLFTRAALASQKALPGLNGERNTFFCGSYFGFGFHEDAVKSGAAVARDFGLELQRGTTMIDIQEAGSAANIQAAEKSAPAKPAAPRPSLLEGLGRRVAFRSLEAISRGCVVLRLPEGGIKVFGDPASALRAEVAVARERFFRRILVDGDIGFGEGYVEGDWECGDLATLIEIFILNQRAMEARFMRWAWLGRTVNRIRHLRRANTRCGSRRNIRDHYDLGNGFFSTFLDPSMTYSCALYRDPEDTLETAQRNKIHAVIEKAGIGPDDHVLEIGSGWGGFALEAARSTGCRVTTITMSGEQLAYARDRVRRAGLEQRISVELCDYRDVRGRFDKVVSIEMLEAVGHEFLPDFFGAVDRLLKPGGRAVIQVITMPDQRYDAYRRGVDWIQRHIFPGSLLPSLTALCEAMTSGSELVVERVDNIGLHYARTLREWDGRFEAARERVDALGFGPEFRRKWRYYFAYCEAGFATKALGDLQLVLGRAEAPAGKASALKVLK